MERERLRCERDNPVSEGMNLVGRSCGRMWIQVQKHLEKKREVDMLISSQMSTIGYPKQVVSHEIIYTTVA